MNFCSKSGLKPKVNFGSNSSPKFTPVLSSIEVEHKFTEVEHKLENLLKLVQDYFAMLYKPEIGFDTLDAHHKPLVSTEVALPVWQKVPSKEPKQQVEIFEPCVADLIQPIEVLDTLPIVKKDDSIVIDEEKVPQGSVTLEGANDAMVMPRVCKQILDGEA